MTPVIIQLGDGRIGIHGASAGEIGEGYFLKLSLLPRRYPIGSDVECGIEGEEPLAEIRLRGVEDIQVLHGVLTKMLNHARNSGWKVMRVVR